MESPSRKAAQALADDPRGLDFADASDPSRIDTLGDVLRRRILYVVSTEVGPRLRTISARRATAHERRIYADEP